MSIQNLEEFPFDKNLLSSKQKGKFPDISIRLNKNSELFTGGELVELKNSKQYTVSSFNSTVPTGKKDIASIIGNEKSSIRQQMEKAGDDIFSLEKREVFYLIRGKRKNEAQKIVLIHGSFFETITKEELIRKSFKQVLIEGLEHNPSSNIELERILNYLKVQQEHFSKVRTVENASVKLRFRIMTEVSPEGNILNTSIYPAILDNTLNFILPYYNDSHRNVIMKKIRSIFDTKALLDIEVKKIKHIFKGNFLLFQTKI